MGKKAELIRERGQKQYGKEGESNMGIKANMMHIRKENADSQPFFHKPTTKRRSSWYNVREAMSRAVSGIAGFCHARMNKNPDMPETSGRMHASEMARSAIEPLRSSNPAS